LERSEFSQGLQVVIGPKITNQLLAEGFRSDKFGTPFDPDKVAFVQIKIGTLIVSRRSTPYQFFRIQQKEITRYVILFIAGVHQFNWLCGKECTPKQPFPKFF